MEFHALIGYCVLTLIIFRVCWGLVGSHHARFIHFVPSPKGLVNYILGKTKAGLGHNPLGALSVLALLVSLGLQATTGLFANDDIAFEGPFAKYVSNDMVQFLTSIHYFNEKVLIILIALHLCAILYYQKFKGENLIKPMLLGDKEIDPSEEAKYLPADLGQASKDGGLQRGFALLLLSLIAVILGYFITN
jgi:cytochrome b